MYIQSVAMQQNSTAGTYTVVWSEAVNIDANAFVVGYEVTVT